MTLYVVFETIKSYIKTYIFILTSLSDPIVTKLQLKLNSFQVELNQWLFCGKILSFQEKCFGKEMLCHKCPIFGEKKSPKFSTTAYKYERVLKIFFFHILSIAKFG
jgi:hypothetical protein